ncbi:hypothetical protein F5I97DRAFT_483813 [Phlebopus sp. FC_14]|nr:hypothetical protein F5I97DRAFT_483813 [Phlebopus sp. FC_14]
MRPFVCSPSESASCYRTRTPPGRKPQASPIALTFVPGFLPCRALKSKLSAATMPIDTPALPVLPVELWLEVFDHATFVPHILEPDIYQQTRSIGAYFNRKHYRIIQDALVTKRSLVLVCKAWLR